MKQPTVVKSDAYVRTFDASSSYYDETAECNLFFLHARKKELGRVIMHRKYETLNNACRVLGVREFVNGNYIGWQTNGISVDEIVPYDIIPVNPEDDTCSEFRIKFKNLTLLNLKEILKED